MPFYGRHTNVVREQCAIVWNPVGVRTILGVRPGVPLTLSRRPQALLCDPVGVNRNCETPAGSIAIRCDSTRNGFHNTAWGRRTAAHPRRLTELDPNPNGGSTMARANNARRVEPRRGSPPLWGVRPGVPPLPRRPRLCCATPLGSIAIVRAGTIPNVRPRLGSIAMMRRRRDRQSQTYRSSDRHVVFSRSAGTLPEMSHACDAVPDPECTVLTFAHETG